MSNDALVIPPLSNADDCQRTITTSIRFVRSLSASSKRLGKEIPEHRVSMRNRVDVIYDVCYNFYRGEHNVKEGKTPSLAKE